MTDDLGHATRPARKLAVGDDQAVLGAVAKLAEDRFAPVPMSTTARPPFPPRTSTICSPTVSWAPLCPGGTADWATAPRNAIPSPCGR